jgi:hypothetical protein
MKNKEDVIKRIRAGNPTKYRPEIHLKLLLDIFGEGEGPMAFCAEAAIGQTTFHLWLRTHKEFKETHDVAINLAGRIWEKYPKDNPDFGYPYWYAIMRNRFGYGKSRVRKAKDNTPLARIEAIWKGCEEGELSGQETTPLVAVVRAQADILDKQSYEPGEHKVETAEAIMETVNAIQKVLDSRKKDKEA